MAELVPVGEPAHDAERQAIRFLVEGLPADYSVYSNALLAERSGVTYELDAVVVAPHGIYVVECKAYRGTVRGNDHDWYESARHLPSPLKLNRKTAQIFASELKRQIWDAGRCWVEHFVFLSHADVIDVSGPASRDRVHGRKTILAALQNAQALADRSGRGKPAPVDETIRNQIRKLITGADRSRQRPRQIREYELKEALERTDHYAEYLARHQMDGRESVLRVYPIPYLAEQGDRDLRLTRYRWESQVLNRVGQHRHILRADPSFEDEYGFCVPFERFAGVTLTTWMETHGKKSGGKTFPARLKIFEKIAEAIQHAHRQGVVHRLLRPEVVLLENTPDDPDLRVTGFDLAKQLQSPHTVVVTTLHDERLRWASPEVAQGFSNATPQSDQFGLGALLAFLLGGTPPFESTTELMRDHGRIRSIRSLNPFVPQTLENAIQRMLRLRPTDRFPTLDEALDAVRSAAPDQAARAPATVLDPENLPPETQVGADYVIKRRLGAGGMATVYLARHLLSGKSHALKVAHRNPRAESTLQDEYRATHEFHHPNVVHGVNLYGGLIPNHLVLAMDHVEGESLASWLAARHEADRVTLRRWSEELLAALAYLEEKGVTHKDLKPDNLIVGSAGLTVIDFSLAAQPANQILIGTALYRDPALKEWDAAADRYAAALCLFELWVGRHAFDDQAPSPDEAPRIDPAEVDPPALAAFFARALDPRRDARFPSAVAMRTELVKALGEKTKAAPDAPLLDWGTASTAATDAGDASLSGTRLSTTAQAVLRRAGIRTQGELVALTAAQIDAIPGLGKKKRREILEFQSELRQRGVVAPEAQAQPPRGIWDALAGDETPIDALGLKDVLAELLRRNGFTTVGRLAVATRADLERVGGIRAARFAQVVQALQVHEERRAGKVTQPRTLRDLWNQLVLPLDDKQRAILAGSFGIFGEPQTQAEIGEPLSLSNVDVSREQSRALERIDRAVIRPLVDLLATELRLSSGILPLPDALERMELTWPSDDELRVEGLVSMVAHTHASELRVAPPPEDRAHPLLVAPASETADDVLQTFVRSARTLAGWPLTDAEAVRKSLRAILPEYELDLLLLAVRIVPDLRLTDAGDLCEAPIRLEHAIEYVLRRGRLPIGVSDLAAAVQRAFGDAVPDFDEADLAAKVPVLGAFRVEDGKVVATTGWIERKDEGGDAIPAELVVAAKTPEEVAGELLRQASRHPGFRLVVTPAREHVEIGRSLERALVDGCVHLSFESMLLERMESNFARFERAEKYAAQRPALRKEAEALFAELVAEHGRPGAVVVLADTAILEVCGMTDLPQLLYNRASTGEIGFWACVIPGIVRDKQPYLNERKPLFHIPGIVLPLRNEIPAA